jgi:glycine/D-amino acid oxidase-like deaminating enzyme
MSASDSTVIIGAGINGLATAFYFARGQKRRTNTSIIETSSDVVSAAAGKANDVLPDYDHSPPVADLAHLSWKLHLELATTYNGAENWGYAETLRHELFNINVENGNENGEQRLQPQYPLPEWLRGREKYSQVIKGNPYNCARVYV